MQRCTLPAQANSKQGCRLVSFAECQSIKVRGGDVNILFNMQNMLFERQYAHNANKYVKYAVYAFSKSKRICKTICRMCKTICKIWSPYAPPFPHEFAYPLFLYVKNKEYQK